MLIEAISPCSSDWSNIYTFVALYYLKVLKWIVFSFYLICTPFHPFCIVYGLQSKKVVDAQFDKLSIHGIGKDHSSNWWKALAYQLIYSGTYLSTAVPLCKRNIFLIIKISSQFPCSQHNFWLYIDWIIHALWYCPVLFCNSLASCIFRSCGHAFLVQWIGIKF